MLAAMENSGSHRLIEVFDRLKSSQLLMVVGGLFVIDLFIPDPVPFLDEAFLGLLTLLLARWQLRRGDARDRKPNVKNVTPKDPPGGGLRTRTESADGERDSAP
jgi:hypothetical protein